MTFETFDQSDEKTWPDQKIPTYLHTYPLTYLPTYLCTSIREQPIGAIIGTCDIWDTDYNTDNWEPGFMTIFVTLKLIVTLDSIRNSCDVLNNLKVAPGRWDSVKNITHTYLYLWCPALIHYDHQRGKLMTKFKLSNRRNRYDIIMINAHWQFPQLGSI